MREGGLRRVGEDVVWRLLSDIHFVVIKGMEGVLGMRWVRVDGLVKVGRKECCRGGVVGRQ